MRSSFFKAIAAALLLIAAPAFAGVPTGDFAVNWAPMATANPFSPASFTQIDASRNVQLVNGEGVFPTSAYSSITRWAYNGAMQPSPSAIRAKIEIAAYHTGDYMLAWVGDSSGEGYVLQINTTSVSIAAVNSAGTLTGLTSGSVATASVGDVFELEYIPSTKTLNAYQNGTLISGLSVTDSTYTPTTFGFAFAPQNANGSEIAAFAGDGSVVSGSCTNAGYEPAGGVIAIPNGTSGTFLGCTTQYVTPNCSSVTYYQPHGGKCGVN